MKVSYVSDSSAAMLDKAILLYSGSSNFATLHDVRDNVIQPGRPLDTADLEQLFRNDGKRGSGCVYLPENVLQYNRDSITWYARQKTAPIFFKASIAGHAKMNKINGKSVRWPALLFRLQQSSLECFALSNDKRPEPSTALYRAPFWNVSDAATVCMPSGIREKLWSKDGIGNITLNAMQVMEEAFYQSAFSHPNDKKSIIRGGHNAYWLAAVKHPEVKFDTAALIKTGLKLKDILK